MRTKRDEAKQVRALLKGRVQGVGFRYFVQREAVRLGLTGWVRNLDGGAVELVARGPEVRLRELLARIQDGPALSRVDSAVVDWQAPDSSLAGFEVRATQW